MKPMIPKDKKINLHYSEGQLEIFLLVDLQFFFQI